MSGRVSEQLGTGSSFDRTRGSVSARRQAVAAATGVPTAGAPDSRLRTLPLDQLVPTRFNPRRNFGTEEDLVEFGLKLKKKQLQPAVAVTRDAYLALWPDEVGWLGAAKYVIANGERRYRGSQAVGLTTLEVVVDDDIAASRADFLDAVLSENNDREDLDPIERALGIKTMVEQLGGKAKVAEHYGKSGGWVTQQMYLLDLVPSLQELVSSGELPVRETRALVKLPPEQQASAWQSRQVAREEERVLPRASRKREELPQDNTGSGPAEPAETFTAVKKPPQQPGPKELTSPSGPPEEMHKPDEPEASFTAVKQPAPPKPPGAPSDDSPPPPAGSPEQMPEPRSEDAPGTQQASGDTGQQPKRLPYDDGSFIAQHLILKMPTDELVKMLRLLNQHAEQNGLEVTASAR